MLCFKPYFDFQRDSKESLFFAYINTQTIIITLSQTAKEAHPDQKIKPIKTA